LAEKWESLLKDSVQSCVSGTYAACIKA